MKTTYKVATRKSKLAIRQTEIVLDGLRRLSGIDKFEIASVRTKGDIDKRPLFSMDRKGLFEREVNNAVVNGDADFAVHSLKDIPTDFDSELIIAAIPKRANPQDVMVALKKVKLKELPGGAKIGTSSLRRAIQILQKNPDVNVLPVRGNIETRINKAWSGLFDAVVLADAGLTRLGMEDLIVERFDVEDFLPAPGQGAMAVVCRKDNKQLISLLKKIEHKSSRISIDAERALMNDIGGGCRFPVGALAVCDLETKTIRLCVKAFSADGKKSIGLEKIGAMTRAREIGKEMAQSLIRNGIEEMAQGWRDALDSWNNI
ncbi:MAG: hydroxymethylbilane synthase [Thermoproteota archaeon]|nr:hydroxymethylbilane synthase [Thermoproteota archaeon]